MSANKLSKVFFLRDLALQDMLFYVLIDWMPIHLFDINYL